MLGFLKNYLPYSYFTAPVTLDKLSEQNEGVLHAKIEIKTCKYIKASNIFKKIGITFSCLGAIGFGCTALAYGSTVISLSLYLIPLTMIIFAISMFKLSQWAYRSRTREDISGFVPIGISNSSNNCAINSLMQMAIRSPLITNLMESGNFTDFSDFLYTYQSALSEATPVGERATELLRQSFARLFPNSISRTNHIDLDPSELLRLLFSTYDPSTYLETEVQYDQRAHPMNEPDKRNGVGVEREDSYVLIPLNMTGTFQQSLNRFFDDRSPEAETAKFMGADGVEHQYSRIRERRRFTSTPDELFIQVRRFSGDFVQVKSDDKESDSSKKDSKSDESVKKDDGGLVFQSRKDSREFNVVRELSLSARDVSSDKEEIYDLDSIVLHLGASLDGGHYISYNKVNGIWYKCNDNRVYTAISDEELDLVLSQSYLVHYKLRS
jgi:hypothetical protein